MKSRIIVHFKNPFRIEKGSPSDGTALRCMTGRNGRIARSLPAVQTTAIWQASPWSAPKEVNYK